MANKLLNPAGSYSMQKIGGRDYFFVVVPATGKENRKRIYGTTIEELEKNIDGYKSQRLAKSTISASSTITQLCYDYLKCGCYAKEEQLERYRNIIKIRIEGWEDFNFGDMIASTVQPSTIGDYLSSLTSSFSERSIERTFALLEQVIMYGIERGIIPEDFQFDRIQKPTGNDIKTKPKKSVIIGKEEMQMIAKECLRKSAKNEPYYEISAKIIYMIIFTGANADEMCSLKWKDVASDFSHINIMGNRTGNETSSSKSGSQTLDRRIPLPKEAKDLLIQHLEDRVSDESNPTTRELINDEFVFLSRSNKTETRARVEKTFGNIVENCALSSFISTQTLRYAYGSYLISAGVDIGVVSKLLGHKSVAFTYDTYNINELESAETKAVEAIDKIISTNGMEAIGDKGIVAPDIMSAEGLQRLLCFLVERSNITVSELLSEYDAAQDFAASYEDQQ